MGTIALNPEALKPGLPPGGCPSWDDEFMDWCREFVRGWEIAWLLADDPQWEGFNLRRSLKLCPRNLDLRVAGCPLNVWRLLSHLFKWLHGEVSYPSGINHNHRIRFIAVQFHYRQHDLIEEATRYTEKIFSEAAS